MTNSPSRFQDRIWILIHEKDKSCANIFFKDCFFGWTKLDFVKKYIFDMYVCLRRHVNAYETKGIWRIWISRISRITKSIVIFFPAGSQCWSQGDDDHVKQTQNTSCTPPKTKMSPKKGTISIGNTFSNHGISGKMSVFLGVIIQHASVSIDLQSWIPPNP